MVLETAFKISAKLRKQSVTEYHKIPIISMGLSLFKRLFWWAYFRGGGVGGSLLLEENLHFISKWFGLDNKNSLSH